MIKKKDVVKKYLPFVIALSSALPLMSVQAQVDSIPYQQAIQLKQSSKPAEAENAFMAIVAREPNNVFAIEQLAIVQSWQNKFPAAIENFKRALSINAHYTSARIGLARVSYWQGERTVALTEIDRVIQEQPTVPDNWILKGDILMADSQPSQARNAYLQAKNLLGEQATPELEKKISQAKAAKQWRMDAGYIADKFSQNRTDGHSAYLQMGYTFANKTTLYVRSEEYLSFDSTDTGIVLGGYYSPHKAVLLNGEYYTNSNDANFRPKQQLSLNADFLLSNSWQPLLSYRQATYNIFGGFGEGDVKTIMPGVRFNYANTSVEFRHARSNNIDDTNTATNTLKLNLHYAKVAPYIFYTNGEEGLPPLEVAKISVVGVGAVFTINDSISVRVDYSREDRKEAYIHNSLGAGVSVFF